MALTSFTTGNGSIVAQVRCDDCGAEAPKVERPERLQARRRAERSAEDQGFISYQNGKTWVCPACRIRRIPDEEKPRFPNLCARYGIPLPAPQAKPPENTDSPRTGNEGQPPAEYNEHPPAENNEHPPADTNEPCPPADNNERPPAKNKDRPRTKRRKRKGD